MLLASVSAQFTAIDWAIVIGFLALTTLLGTLLAGKQATMRDFFLGGRKLPWYAVSGSIIATEISAVTFISVPFVVFKPGGNFAYLQLGVFGSLLARIIVGYVLVPQYFRNEIYSPYDYMGNRLGQRVRTMTSGLFVLGAMLAQAARVYLTGQIMIVLLNPQLHWLASQFGLDELAWAMIILGIVAIGWALVGGITTVIWTNLMLFLMFLVGAIIALFVAANHLEGGFAELFRVGWNAKGCGPWGKFTFFDLSPSPFKDLTIWTAVIASTWGGLFSYGTDQMLVQGMFTCRDEKQARKAIIGSAFGQVVTATVMLVGVGLYAYYQAHPLTGDAKAMVDAKGDRVFLVFICEAIPVGWKGLVMAAAVAAAISTIMGILTALSQTVMGAFIGPLRRKALLSRLGSADAVEAHLQSPAEHKFNLVLSRALIVFWGATLCVLAYLTEQVANKEPTILQLALSAAGYAGGALLGCFALAFLPFGVDGRGYMWSAPLSVLSVYALAWHNPASRYACAALSLAMFAGWIAYRLTEREAASGGRRVVRRELQTLVFGLGLAMAVTINHLAVWYLRDPHGTEHEATIAWPWYAPFGSLVAVIWGYLLARRRVEHAPAAGRLATAH